MTAIGLSVTTVIFVLKIIMTEKKHDTFCPSSREEWRKWLCENHHIEQSVWLIYYKKNTQIASISYSDAVDEALCFGWIDSTRKTLDEQRFTQFFCKRKSKSVWSKVNKEKVARLISEGLMESAGLESIRIAKENGSWNSLDEAEALVIPPDLTEELRAHHHAEAFFLGLSNSSRKAILMWIVLAKRPETRRNRIRQIAELAAKGQKPPQFSR